MDHPFKQLEWDAQQKDGPVALRIFLGLRRLREVDDSYLASDLGDFTSFQTGRHTDTANWLQHLLHIRGILDEYHLVQVLRLPSWTSGLPSVRRLIACQAFRLECVKSMDSTVSIQRS